MWQSRSASVCGLLSPQGILEDRTVLEDGMRRMADWLITNGNFRLEGDPPQRIYSFGTPLFLSHSMHESMVRWTRKVSLALEELGRHFLRRPDAAKSLQLFRDPVEEEFFRLDVDLPWLAPIFRLDLAVEASTGTFRLMEINCGCPGGELDPALVAHAFQGSSLRLCLERISSSDTDRPRIWRFYDPRRESLERLLRCYTAFRKANPSLPVHPTIALITSEAQAHFMLPESRGIAEYFSAKGYRVRIGGLLDLEPHGEEILLQGEPVHLLYRKFSTHSFRLRMEDGDRFGEKTVRRVRGIWKAVQEGQVCVINPLGSTFLQDKGLLECLLKRHPDLAPLVPTTVILREELPHEDPDCWKEITRGEAFILKRRRSFSGRHVVMEPDAVRQLAPKLLKEEPGQWVAQERISLARYPFAVMRQGSIRMGVFPFTVDPFGWSCFVRVGIGDPWGPINAHRGSAEGFALIPERGYPTPFKGKDVWIDWDAPFPSPVLEESEGFPATKGCLPASFPKGGRK